MTRPIHSRCTWPRGHVPPPGWVWTTDDPDMIELIDPATHTAAVAAERDRASPPPDAAEQARQDAYAAETARIAAAARKHIP